jgi:hypothetical protein
VIEVAFNDSILAVITPTLWGYTETLIRFVRKNFHRLSDWIRTNEIMLPKQARITICGTPSFYYFVFKELLYQVDDTKF